MRAVSGAPAGLCTCATPRVCEACQSEGFGWFVGGATQRLRDGDWVWRARSPAYPELVGVHRDRAEAVRLLCEAIEATLYDG